MQMGYCPSLYQTNNSVRPSIRQITPEMHQMVYDFYALRHGDLSISGYRTGLGDILDAGEPFSADLAEAEEEDVASSALLVVPNMVSQSLVNAILKEERVIIL